MLKNHLYKSTSFTLLKRKIYIILLPVFIFAFAMVLVLLYINQGFIDSLNILTFALLIGGLSLCWVAILKKQELFEIAELLVFFLATLLFLLRMLVDLMENLGVQGDDHLGTVSYWTALYYFLVFFTFKGKGALFSSVSTFSIIAAAGGYHILFSANANGDTVDTIIQFSIATLGTIVTLYYIQRMIEAFLDTEISKYQANTDYLTQLPNRRKMEQILEQERNISQNQGTPFTVAMFDVDFFKKINDNYGHDVGDSVLQELTDLIAADKRETESFGRWGGEEFLVVFANIDLDTGLERSRYICELINKHDFTKAGKLTCSFGIAEYQKGEELKDLLKRSDKALYLAKENGRNRVESA